MNARKKIITAAIVLCVLLSLCPAALAEGEDARFENKTWEELVHEYLEGLSVAENRVAIGYRNLVTGEEHYLNPDQYMVAASMFKVPLNMVYAQKVADGEMTWSDTVGGVPLQTLMEGCIIDSNNNFAQILWSDLGHGSYRGYREQIAPYMGEDAATVDPKYYENNFFTPRQMIYCLNLLYTGREQFPLIIETMQRAEPETYFKRSERRFDIAHKFGFLTPEWHVHINDCAIAFTDDPIAFVCFTDNIGNAFDVLDGLATLLCDYAQYHTAEHRRVEAAAGNAAAPLTLRRPVAVTGADVAADRLDEAEEREDDLLPSFIVRVAAVTAGLLVLAGLVRLCRRNRIWFLWVPLALAFAVGAVYASLHITSTGALLNRETVETVVASAASDPDPQEAAVRYLDALCDQDYGTVNELMRGYVSLGLEQEPEDAVDAAVLQTLRQSIAYSLRGDIAAGPGQASLPITLRALDLAQVEEALRAETAAQLILIGEQRPAGEIFDAEGAFLPEIVQQACETAAGLVLARSADYELASDLDLSLILSGGEWVAKPDAAFVRVVTGAGAESPET